MRNSYKNYKFKHKMDNLKKQNVRVEYSAPECSVFDVCIENGFADSRVTSSMSVDSAAEKYYGSF